MAHLNIQQIQLFGEVHSVCRKLSALLQYGSLLKYKQTAKLLYFKIKMRLC